MAQVDDLLTQLTSQVDAVDTVEDGVIAYIKGVPALIAAAVASATPALTPAQVQVFTDLGNKITAKAAEAAAAVTANTPAANP